MNAKMFDVPMVAPALIWSICSCVSVQETGRESYAHRVSTHSFRHIVLS